MFVRVRWFLAGMAAAVGGIGYLAAQVKRARQRLTPANLMAVGKQRAATWLDAAADRVAPRDSGQTGA